MASNRETGDTFHRIANVALRKATGHVFETDVALPLGNPPRDHRFDFATADRRIVGEAKAHTWTAGGNAPSAKIGHLKEAVQFLQGLPAGTKRFIVMKRHCRRSRGEPLADYFARLNDNILGDVSVLELCEETGGLRLVYGDEI